MSILPRLPLFAATLTLLSLTLALVFLSGQPIPAAQAQTTPTTATTVDYDSNDDRLIEISNLAQLNAIRWDLNGDGAVAAGDQTSYTAAFPNAATGMGCPDSSDADANPDPCLGYELKADLTFDTNGDGSVTAADSAGLYWNNGAGWTPLGDARNYPFTGQFQGRGKVISHLFINNATAPHLGLFGAIGHRGSVAGVGLTEVSIASSVPTTAGSLVGSSTGRVTTSYATGAIAVNISSASRINAMAGGLVGYNGLAGTVQASFAEVAVSVRHNSASAIVGGLAGQSGGSIRASYAAGAVSGHGNTRFTKVGGLTGNNGGTITASYARGKVTATGSGAAGGGLVGGNLRNGRVVASYWDTTTSGQTGSAGGTGQTTRALQGPKGYTGIFANWNLNLDGAAGGDSPWHFGGAYQYPLLEYGDVKAATQQRDYDTDNDQLIEVNNLAQLNAIRWDLNTDGVVAAADQDKYDAAFPGAVAGMGCALGATAAACTGYELMSDLDFDTDGDGDVDAADSGGLYWNGGWGWRPIGFATNGLYIGNLTGTFQGNGKTISNLYINQPPTAEIIDNYSLFGWVGTTGVIDGVNLRDVNIRIQLGGQVGPLAGANSGTIRGSSATGRINSDGPFGESVGGLVGQNFGSIASSYARTEITGNVLVVGGLVGRNGKDPYAERYGSIVASYSGGANITIYNSTSHGNNAYVGGLVGSNNGTITASYSRSPVKATGNGALVGGLVGDNYRGPSTNQGIVTASYALGTVEATGTNPSVGGLVGSNGGPITTSYSRSPVKAAGNSASAGGLVGYNTGPITAAYSRSPVKATGNNAVIGGLVGWNGRLTRSNTTYPGTITASYAVGPVVTTGTNPAVGGLVGRNGRVASNGQEVANSKGTAVDSYWDIAVSGQSSSALGTGVRGLAVAWHPNYIYPGLFANWNLNLDGVAGKDDPWHFGHGLYPMLKYGGHQVRDQLHLRIGDPAVGQPAPTHWFPIQSQSGLTKVNGQGYVWERSDDGVTGWTIVRSRQDGIGTNRYGNGSSRLLIEPYEANKRFRVGRRSGEGVWVSGIVSTPATPWGGPTATLTFASGHTAPRVGQAIAISGSDNVRWIRCADTADNGCDVIVRSATGYTPVAADQGKYLYAYRYYNNSNGVKTMGKTAVIGPVGAAAATP